MNKRDILTLKAEHRDEDERPVFLDGFDAAIAGVVDDGVMRVVYDRAKCVRILQEKDRMTQDEAEDFLEYNAVGSVLFLDTLE